MIQQPWFFPQLLSDPACRPYAVLFIAGLFGFLAAASVLLSALNTLDERDWELYELSQPVEIFHYSPYGELQAWDGYVEFIRSGACVGWIRNGVSQIGWRGGKSGRVLEIAYADGSHDEIDCGPAGWSEARRAGSIVMRYTGRHAYG